MHCEISWGNLPWALTRWDGNPYREARWFWFMCSYLLAERVHQRSYLIFGALSPFPSALALLNATFYLIAFPGSMFIAHLHRDPRLCLTLLPLHLAQSTGRGSVEFINNPLGLFLYFTFPLTSYQSYEELKFSVLWISTAFCLLWWLKSRQQKGEKKLYPK